MDVIFYIKKTPFVFSWFVKFHYEVYHCRCECRWSCPHQNAIANYCHLELPGSPLIRCSAQCPISKATCWAQNSLGENDTIFLPFVYTLIYSPQEGKKKMLFFELGSVIWKLRWVPVIKSQGCLKNPIKKKIVLKTN